MVHVAGIDGGQLRLSGPVLADQPGDNAWPITGVSFILMYTRQHDASRSSYARADPSS